jgi:hypothetical protein
MHAPRRRSLGPAPGRVGLSFFSKYVVYHAFATFLEVPPFPTSLPISVTSVLLFGSNGYTQGKLLTCVSVHAQILYETRPPSFLLLRSSAHSASLR